jgi:cell division protein FtsN
MTSMLNIKGFNPIETEMTLESYAVQIGSFDSPAEAISAKEKLARQGFKKSFIKENN